MRKPYKLTPSELEIIQLGADDPNIITDYFFRPRGGAKGWRFDENFDPEGAWQKDVHFAEQTDIVVIGGFGTGKTSGVAISASTWGLTTPWFKFLNVAPKQWQARQMYDYILVTSAGTPFEQIIWEKPRRPFPKIVLKYQIGDAVYESSMEFMSADRDATGILSWEGDWINVEEAGLLDNLEEIVTALGSRLRGSVRGRRRLGRLSMISNSWDNQYMWSYFDQAISEPDKYLSIVVSTRHNHNVDKDHLEKMLKRIPEDEREQFIDGARPEGRGKFFSKPAIYRCEDRLLGEIIEKKSADNEPGYSLQKLQGAGVIYYTTPRKSEPVYIVLGDPGTGEVPARNAPAIMVWEVPLCFPSKPAVLSGFWWGSGHGAISPFVDQLLEFRGLYDPVLCGIDSTSTQKNMAEMINLQLLSGDLLVRETESIDEENPSVGFSKDIGITGLDFSGTKKSGYLVVLRMFIEAGLLVWPKSAFGIRSQLSNYDPARDKKIAQDLVATLAMSAYVIRTYFNVDLSEIAIPKVVPQVENDLVLIRRKPVALREQRSTTRTESAQNRPR